MCSPLVEDVRILVGTLGDPDINTDFALLDVIEPMHVGMYARRSCVILLSCQCPIVVLVQTPSCLTLLALIAECPQ
jgi:hypothetical protein